MAVYGLSMKILTPYFLTERYFGDLRTSLVEFFMDELKVCHISTCAQVYLMIHWFRNCVTCYVCHDVNLHRVCSWYDHPLRVLAYFLVIRCTTLSPWPLTFSPWTLVKHDRSRGQLLRQVWRSYACPFLSYELWPPPLDSIDNEFSATAHAS